MFKKLPIIIAISVSASVSADMKILISAFYRYRPIRKRELSALYRYRPIWKKAYRPYTKLYNYFSAYLNLTSLFAIILLWPSWFKVFVILFIFCLLLNQNCSEVVVTTIRYIVGHNIKSCIYVCSYFWG